MPAVMEITKGGRRVYVVYVSREGERVPGFESIFTGDDERYPTLNSGIQAAQAWISESEERKDYKIEYRIVGCL